MTSGLIDVSLGGDLLKRTVAAIVVQNIFRAGQALRAAHHRNAFPDTRGSVARRGGSGQIEIDVVGDHQVEAAVAIIVDKGATGSPSLAGACHAGFLAHIGECSVAVVVIQHILTVIGDIEIFQPSLS